jgi:hypothetical protein
MPLCPHKEGCRRRGLNYRFNPVICPAMFEELRRVLLILEVRMNLIGNPEGP